jgi:signal transduction histidine kinase
VSRSIANPLRRLTQAAKTVADIANAELVRVTDEEGAEEQPPQLAAIELPTGDEIGELAVAFNQVQATASLLVERQTTTRRNVSLMFTNVAQRTRNLVGQQLAVVDELERDEQNVLLLGRLYRLDHLSTRLRRNAENLLVVAGARTEARVKGPTPLATILRAALTEIEEYQRIRFGDICSVTIDAAPASDLVLVFAELLENAAVFSPPESSVEVRAEVIPHGECRVSIVDHGIGMTQQRMIQENRRLVERERLDIAPTSVLGLFVVGRLSKRHGLVVELAPTRGGGTTAYVLIPSGLFNAGAVPEAAALPGAADSSRAYAVQGSRFVGSRPTPAMPRPVMVPAPRGPAEPFSWFSNGNGRRSATITTGDPSSMPTGPIPADGSGFGRRVPGAQVPTAAASPPGVPPATRPPHDPGAVHAAMDAYQSSGNHGASRQQAAGPPGGPPGGRLGLARRVPGANLAPGIRPMPPAEPQPRGGAWQARDPSAVREAFDAYTTGLAKGQQSQSRPAPTGHHHLPRENQQ